MEKGEWIDDEVEAVRKQSKQKESKYDKDEEDRKRKWWKRRQ